MKALEAAAITGRRSPLFLWLYRNHEDFGAMLRKAGKPNWKAIATTLVNDGLFPRDKKHDTVRQTWIAVRKALDREEMEARRAKQSAAQPRDEFSFREDPLIIGDDFSDIEKIT